MSQYIVVFPSKAAVVTAVHSAPLLPDGEWGNGVPSNNGLRMHAFPDWMLVPTVAETPGTLDTLNAILDPDTQQPCVSIYVDEPLWKTLANWVDVPSDE